MKHKYKLSQAINREICTGSIITRKLRKGTDRITGAEVKQDGTLVAYCENGFSMVQEGVFGVEPSEYDKSRVDWLLLFACSLSVTHDNEVVEDNLIDKFIDEMVNELVNDKSISVIE